MFFVDFTHGDDVEKLGQRTDLQFAIAFAKAKAAEYKAAGKSGVISVYQMTTERGKPMQKVFEIVEV